MKYEVGQKVKIKSLDWYNANRDEYGYVDCGSREFSPKMSDLCGKIATIKEICKTNCYHLEEYDFDWTDEMIEGLAEEEAKSEPKFKVGDRVKWFNHTCNITAIDTDEDTYTDLIKHDDYREGKSFAKWVPESELTFEDDEEMKSKDELVDEYEELTDRAFKGGYEKCKFDIELNGFQLPDGYIFKDENGNVINATKIILEKKKKEYPKTYEECCKIMQVARPTMWFDYDDVRSISKEGDEYESHIENTLCAFRKLLICRDAYWKIAGEEMGLEKPWEPDLNHINRKFYCIYNSKNNIVKNVIYSENKILAFPTEEMQDAFYENFKEEIESCKELL